MFSDEQLEQLRSFPAIGKDDLIWFFTLTKGDLAFVDPGRGRGPADRKSAPADGGEMKELEQFLLGRAMEHDSPTLLFNLAAEFLMSAKTIRPGVSVLERMISSARTGATVLTSDLVGHLLTGQRCSDLDRLLAAMPGWG